MAKLNKYGVFLYRHDMSYLTRAMTIKKHRHWLAEVLIKLNVMVKAILAYSGTHLVVT